MIFEFLKQQRRRRQRSRPFPQEWLKLIQRHVVFFHKLPAMDRAELLGHIQVFLAEKRFEGCGGFEITDEVRVTIAAQACLLLLHRNTDYFPGLLTILVYPLRTHSLSRTVQPCPQLLLAEYPSPFHIL